MNRSKEFSANAPIVNTVLLQEEVRAQDNTVAVQVVNAGTTTTLIYEVSNDGTNWVATPGTTVGFQSAPSYSSTSTTANIFIFMVQARYFRIRVSVAGTGVVSGVACFGEGWSR